MLLYYEVPLTSPEGKERYIVGRSFQDMGAPASMNIYEFVYMFVWTPHSLRSAPRSLSQTLLLLTLQRIRNVFFLCGAWVLVCVCSWHEKRWSAAFIPWNQNDGHSLLWPLFSGSFSHKLCWTDSMHQLGIIRHTINVWVALVAHTRGLQANFFYTSSKNIDSLVIFLYLCLLHLILDS